MEHRNATNKNAIRICIITFIFGLLIYILYHRHYLIENLIIKKTVLENNQISQIYSKIIWNKNDYAIKLLKNDTHQKLVLNDIFAKFIKDSLSFFSIIESEKVSIYNDSSVEIISSNNKNICANHDINLSFDNLFYYFDRYFYQNSNNHNNIQEAVLKGRSSFLLIPCSVINDGITIKKTIIKTYFPIYTKDSFIVDGAIEIITDITKELDSVNRIILNYLIIFILISIIFFIIITYIKYSVQKSMNRQTQINRELEESRIQAEMKSSAKIQLLANVSHELRTPLSSIIGFSEIILNDNKNTENLNKKYNDYINDINNAGKHLLSIINDILDFSKASSEKLAIANIEIDLNKLCQSIVRLMNRKAEAAGIIITEILPLTHIVIKTDPKRLKQALLNIISNSIKFTPKGGKIILEVKKNNAYKELEIEVTDNGIGISEQDIPKVLGIFHQVDNNLNREYEGTGLGLPLTKKLVELMGGEFAITSQENLGTKVTLKFKI